MLPHPGGIARRRGIALLQAIATCVAGRQTSRKGSGEGSPNRAHLLPYPKAYAYDSGSPHFLNTVSGDVLVAATSVEPHQACASGFSYRLDTPSARAFFGQFVILP
jgi:hypothetical protein